MGDNTINLEAKKFFDDISKGNWVVDFWADWCGPCKMMAPEYDQSASHFKGKVHFGKLDIVNQKGVSDKFGIRSIPTMIAFKDGKVIKQTAGFMESDDISSFVKEAFN